jgi:hypothetical protein
MFRNQVHANINNRAFFNAFNHLRQKAYCQGTEYADIYYAYHQWHRSFW